MLPLPALAVKVQAVPLFRGELDQLGMTVSSDVTSVDGTEVKRTIVLATTAQGDELWPDAAALKSATRRLYGRALALGTPARILTIDPVVAL